jgi:hypothetical protein
LKLCGGFFFSVEKEMKKRRSFLINFPLFHFGGKFF